MPTPLGRLLTAYLDTHFPEYVDVNFTAKVEEQLDEVSGATRQPIGTCNRMHDQWSFESFAS